MLGLFVCIRPVGFESFGAIHESPLRFPGDCFERDERTMTTAFCDTEGETTSLEYLVEAAQAGDREAFGELATRFEPMVYAIAVRRLGNHSEAQELCQE